MKNLTALLCIFIFGSAIGVAQGQQTSKASKPNVVFILADDLGTGDISYNNKDPEWFRYTPNIDEICEQGIYFRNYSVHHVCSPTRAGLLTGMHYTKVGSGSETGGTLHNDIPNVAKDFKANGYVTGAFGKWHNGFPNFPIDGNGASVSRVGDIDSSNNIFEKKDSQEWGEGVNAYGFDRWTGYYSGGGDYFNRYVNGHHEYDWWIDQHYRPDVDGYTTDLIGDAAVGFIEDNKDASFYCYVPMEAVHAPYQVKRSDLQELCSFFPGEWDYIKNVVSPVTGRKISEVAEIRANPGAEFDFTIIDPEYNRFTRLIYSTMAYSMDKAIGRILAKLEEHQLRNNTIVFFSSDNGATLQGSNWNFQGSKHTLWEGGIHVPAAMWWPGTIDVASLDKYAAENNEYEGYIQYIDFYPTIMSLTNSTISAVNLDGIDFSDGLINRVDSRQEYESPYFGINTGWGVIKSGKWKLHYNEVPHVQMLQLYDLDNDPGESNNLYQANSEVTDTLKALYNRWVDSNGWAFSYLPLSMDRVTEPDAAPDGDILEVKAWQTDTLTDSFNVRFSNFAGGGNLAGDITAFDIYIPADTENDSGFYFSPGGGPRPYYLNMNAVNQDSISLNHVKWPRNQWIRNVVGYGNHAPIGGYANYVVFNGTKPGYTHFYLDNIIVRHKDGTIETIWKDNDDFDNLRYRFHDNQYNSLEEVKAIDDFAFSDVQLNAATLVELATLQLKEQMEDILLEEMEAINFNDVFEVLYQPNAIIDFSIEGWTNKDILEVINDTDTDRLLLFRKGDGGGYSDVTISAEFNGQKVTVSFKVEILPQILLDIRDNLEDVILEDTLVILLDDITDINDPPFEAIDLVIESWTNPDFMEVTYDASSHSIVLISKIYEDGQSDVLVSATYQGHDISTSFSVEILEREQGVSVPLTESDIKIYPNPATDRLYISVPGNECTVHMYNIMGSKVLTSQREKVIHLEGMKQGIYFLEIIAGTQIVMKKILLE